MHSSAEPRLIQYVSGFFDGSFSSTTKFVE